MLVTEDEAKTKRCPESFGDGFVADSAMQRAVAFHGGIAAAVIASPAHCIGSACMAWRRYSGPTPEKWDRIVPHPDDLKQRFLDGYGEDPNHKGGMRKKIADAEPSRGFCGKSGTLYRFD